MELHLLPQRSAASLLQALLAWLALLLLRWLLAQACAAHSAG
jgi:hypothetical protein